MKFTEVGNINVRDLSNLLDKRLLLDLSNNDYKIFKTKALNFLTYNRFDLAFKLLFLELKDKNFKYSSNIYLNHIYAFSFGKYTEPGNPQKTGKDVFIQTFLELHQSIEESGFDLNKSIIPISKNNTILNGSHRVASAIFSNKDVYFLKTENKDVLFNYDFFFRRNIPSSMLDNVAIIFSKYAKDLVLKFSTNSFEKENNIVYKKTVKLNLNGVELFKRFFPDISISKHLKTNDHLTLDILLLQNMSSNDNSETNGNKNQFSAEVAESEKVYHYCKHLFNDNFIHFLNYSSILNCNTFIENLDNTKASSKSKNSDLRGKILDYQTTLFLYGINKQLEIEFIYHNQESEDLIFDPQNFFYLENFKVLSFNNAIASLQETVTREEFKRFTKLHKKPLLKPNKTENYKQLFLFYKNYFFYFSEKKIGALLTKMGLYNLVNKLYMKLK